MPETLRPNKLQPQTTPGQKELQIPVFDNPRVEIKESGIHGLGLFARRMLRKGTIIGIYRGVEVAPGEDGDHVLWIYDENEEREYGIDGDNETRFVNHSRSSNAHFDGERLIAQRTIRSGEEITHDYGEAWADLG
jgi:SET domain-containing protein